MKQGYPPLWLSGLALLLALTWRMLGAPVSAQGWQDLQTPLWQARVLLPSRVSRVMTLWMPGSSMPAGETTLRDDGSDVDEQTMRELVRTQDEAMVRVYLAGEDRVALMPLDGYVSGVVAAEMPASYHLEALKAQAVAARTRALCQMEQGGCTRHPGADVCTDSGHCQGYASVEECRGKWGDAYATYRARVLDAVEGTEGQMLTSSGKPITVMYHAISGGRTEDAQTVFALDLPYLQSVDSPSEEGARGLTMDTTFTWKEMASMLSPALEGKELDADTLRQTFTIAGYTPAGRVESVLVDGASLPATRLRSALGLRSTWFSLSADEEGVTFHQRGYGHGVGMSQAGANGMAAQGAGYAEILLHYYPGVTLEKR